MTSQAAAADSWIPDRFACIDRRDADGFAGFLSESGTFRFGNQAPFHLPKEEYEDPADEAAGDE